MPKTVGVYLKEPVFTNRQLYIIPSRQEQCTRMDGKTNVEDSGTIEETIPRSQLDQQRRKEGFVISQTTDNNRGGKGANISQITENDSGGKECGSSNNKGNDARRSVMHNGGKSYSLHCSSSESGLQVKGGKLPRRVDRQRGKDNVLRPF